MDMPALLADFNALWRPFTLFDTNSGRCIGPWMTKLDKLLAGLRWQCSYVQDTTAVEHWLNSICCSIQVRGMHSADMCVRERSVCVQNKHAAEYAQQQPLE